MKLYYSPGACSLSPHIALQEAGLPHELVKVDLKAKTTADGTDFGKINPKSQVPALELDNGELLTEGAVIVQMIADQAADKKLAPANGTPERYRLQEWLNFIGAEVHKTFSPLFNPTLSDDTKAVFRTRLNGKLAYIDGKLAGHDYLMGQQFTVADAYLYTMLRWADRMTIDLSGLKNLTAYKERVAARPKVQAALAAEAAS
jgi:glutathione S-transferase